MKPIVTFGKLVTKRNMMRYSQNKLSIASGVSRAHIAAIESGKRMPSIDIMCMLARPLECEITDLFECEWKEGDNATNQPVPRRRVDTRPPRPNARD